MRTALEVIESLLFRISDVIQRVIKKKKKVFWNTPVANYFGWIINPQKWGFIIMETELEQTLTVFVGSTV